MNMRIELLTLGNLTFDQSLPFWPAFIMMGLSLLFFFSGSRKLGLFALVAGSLALGFAMALLDPFLNIWDEQYHALVAKNLIHDPSTPVLLQHPVFGYDYRQWVYNHVWLHKQPLFLWQMALSIQLFGISALAARLPSIVMHALMSLLIYRMGALAVNRNTGFVAAFLLACASFPLELIAGAHATDHNDVAFLFYVTASCWAWFEYHRSRDLRWAVVIGLLAGGAVLVKWLSGLLVFGMWGISSLPALLTRTGFWPALRPLLVAVAVCGTVALPWQLHIHDAFPEEAAHEYAMMHRHFSEAVEDHSGDWTFHFDQGIKKIYGAGEAVPWLLVLGLLVLLLRTDDRGHRTAMGAAVVAVYGFYSLAATKMIAFPLIVAPFLFLGLGALTDGTFALLRGYLHRNVHRLLLPATVAAMGLLFLDMHQTTIRHSAHHKGKVNEYRHKRMAAVQLTHVLEQHLPPTPHVLFNAAVDFGGELHLMFFTHHVAFGQVPTAEELATVRLLLSDHPIVVLDKGKPLPEHILDDPQVEVVRWNWSRPIVDF
jgi:4-amino-4-deoxy-L-arabinose transferase-like glycosyltransferase